MQLKKIIGYILLLGFLVLSCWSRSWIIFGLLIIGCVYVWHPSANKVVLNKWRQLPLKQRKRWEWLPLVSGGVILIWFVNSFLFSVYTIHSSSMVPALSSGTVLVMNKFKTGSARSINSPDNYYRLGGLRGFERGDVVIFHFPEADTVFEEHPYENYYFKQRQYSVTKTFNPMLRNKVLFQPVSERPLFIKRIVALPGDTVQIVDGNIRVNRIVSDVNSDAVEKYVLNEDAPTKIKEKVIGLAQTHYKEKDHQIVEILQRKVESNGFEAFLERDGDPLNMPDAYVFPFSSYYFWNASYWGPIVVPMKGSSVNLSLRELPIYRRIIETYEGNQLEVDEAVIKINGSPVANYTFKMNYYWVAGDNRPHSFDSRYWGFVPENHMVGTVSAVSFRNQ